MYTGRYQHQSFWNKGLFSSTAEFSGFLQYQLHVKAIVLYFWSFLNVLNAELWFVIGDLNFPREQWFSLLESDNLCNNLSGHSAGKIAVFVVWCYKARGDKEKDLWTYWPPEGCIKQWYDKLECMVASARSVSWVSNETLSLLYLVPWPSTRTYRMKTQGSKNYWFTPLMIFFIHTADDSLLLLLFLRTVSILSGCPVINTHSCYEDMKLSWIGPFAYHPHTRFHYSKLLTYLFYDCGSFSSISGMDLNVSGYRKMCNLYAN